LVSYSSHRPTRATEDALACAVSGPQPQRSNLDRRNSPCHCAGWVTEGEGGGPEKAKPHRAEPARGLRVFCADGLPSDFHRSKPLRPTRPRAVTMPSSPGFGSLNHLNHPVLTIRKEQKNPFSVIARPDSGNSRSTARCPERIDIRPFFCLPRSCGKAELARRRFSLYHCTFERIHRRADRWNCHIRRSDAFARHRGRLT